MNGSRNKKVRTKRSITRNSLTLVCIALLSGCMAGGTLGTGLGRPGVGPQRFGGTQGTGIKSGVQYFTAAGSVTDKRGKPIRDVAVSVETPRSTESVKTDRDGQYAAYVVRAGGEPVVYRFTYHGVTSTYKLPKSISVSRRLEINFVVDDRGHVTRRN